MLLKKKQRTIRLSSIWNVWQQKSLVIMLVPPNTKSTAVAPYGRFVMLLDYNNQSEAPWGDEGYDIPEDCIKCPVQGCTGTFNPENETV